MSQQPKCARSKCPNRAKTGHEGYCGKHSYAFGIVVPMVPITTAQERIHRWMGEGHTIHAISTSTGLHFYTIRGIATGSYNSIRQVTHDTIMGASISPNRAEAWPAARRLQALRAAGHTKAELQAGARLSTRTITLLSFDKYEHISFAVDARVRDYYDQHHMDPVRPPTTAVRKHRWPLPFDWVDIDDPQERRGLLTAEQRADRIPVTTELSDAARFLHATHSENCDFAGATAGVFGTTLMDVLHMRNRTVARETAHRITHMAGRTGWAPAVSEVAA